MEPAPAEPGWPPAHTAWTAVALLNLAYLVSFIDRSILGLLVEPIKADLHLSDTEFALLQGAAFGLFYSLLGIPFGWAIDRLNRTRLIGLCCALWCLMTVACGVASSFARLFVARMGVGVGEAALSPGAASLIADLFPPAKRPLAMSVYASGASIGIGLSMVIGGGLVALFSSVPLPNPVPFIAEMRVWQRVLVSVGLIGLPIAAAIPLLPEPARREASPVRADLRAIFVFLGRYRARFIGQFGGIALYGLVTYALIGWVPALLIRVHGWTATAAGVGFGTIFLVCGPLGALSGGVIASVLRQRGWREPELSTAAIGVFISLPCSIMAGLAGSGVAALAWLAPVALGFAIPTGPSIAAIQQVTPNQLRGQVAALYYLVISLIGLLLGPLVVALLTDNLFHDPRMLGSAIALVAGVTDPLAIALLVLAMRRPA